MTKSTPSQPPQPPKNGIEDAENDVMNESKHQLTALSSKLEEMGVLK